MIRRLYKNGKHFLPYNKILEEQLKSGFIEEVTAVTEEPRNACHYIPHHPVIRESPTTTVRIVYDCSCRSRFGHSINDCLDTGPPLHNAMVDILLRFRTHKI